MSIFEFLHPDFNTLVDVQAQPVCFIIKKDGSLQGGQVSVESW
jgi:hypothetical protein